MRNSWVCLLVALGNLGCAFCTFWPSRKEREGRVLRLDRLPRFHFQLLRGAEDKFYSFSSNSGMAPNITEALYGPQSPLLHICHPQNILGGRVGKVFAYAINWKGGKLLDIG